MADSQTGVPYQALRRVLEACRGSFLWAGFFSLFINLLMLMPAIYMLQVYDRVLTSSSQSTLLMLTLIAVFLFVVMGGLEWVRTQIMIVTSARLDRSLRAPLFDALFARNLASAGQDTSVQPLADLANVRQFLTGPGLLGFFDAPWMPIYIAVLFAFHWMIGAVAIVAALVLLGLTVWNERATHADLREANSHALDAANQTQRNLRNSEAIAAMGMLPRVRQRWLHRQEALLDLQLRASAKGGAIAALSKTFRQAMQTLVLGLGAYLAIRSEITPGAIIAGSILLGRALAPLDLLISSWRGFLTARESYHRVGALLDSQPRSAPPLALPKPIGELRVESLVVKPDGASEPILTNIDFDLPTGVTLGVIGPSGAGKSTLARAILGLMPVTAGAVRIDGAELSQWDRDVLGESIGYLPQDVELLDGTVGENIARFGTVDAERVVAASMAAGVHELILRFPNGYDTRVSGNLLSAGQRQRIGLARALYGEPTLLVLDEPNSNLDQEGDDALAQALVIARQAGRTVIVITHRASVLAQTDRLLLIVGGRIAQYGDRDVVLAALQSSAQRARAAAAPALLARTSASGHAGRAAGEATPSETRP